MTAESWIKMQKKKKKSGTIFIAVGLLLIAAAVGLTVYNVWDGNRAGIASQKIADQMIAQIPKTDQSNANAPDSEDASSEEKIEMASMELDGDLYLGLLEIPSLDLVLPVMTEWSYEGLKTAPCRYSGSCYTNDLVIAAHNYSGHFQNLKQLDVGADIYFTTIDGEQWHYTVDSLETLQPTQVTQMVTADNWDLTLFTCTIGGKSRCTVRCTLNT
jgi:sortase A